MNDLRRGVTGACATIYAIAKIVQYNNDTSDESISLDLIILIEIQETISKPSKYEKIVACLQSCLIINNLEDENYSCLHKQDCAKCGVRRLWSNRLRTTLSFLEVSPQMEEDGDDQLDDIEEGAKVSAVAKDERDTSEPDKGDGENKYRSEILIKDAPLSCP